MNLNLTTFKISNCSIGGDCATGLGLDIQHYLDITAEGYTGSHDIPYEDHLGDDGDVVTNTFKSSVNSAVHAENEIRASIGYDLMQTYKGIQVFVMKINTSSASYFKQDGLTSAEKYWNLRSVKGFNFSPNLTRPPNTSLSALLHSINSSTVQTKSFSNRETMSKFDDVSGLVYAFQISKI